MSKNPNGDLLATHYLVVDGRQLSLTTIKQLVQQHPNHYLVVRDELLTDSVLTEQLQQLTAQAGAGLLGVMPKWRQRMERYFSSPSQFDCDSSYEVALMALFVSADMQRQWQVHSFAGINYVTASRPAKGEDKRKRLMVCDRQPCTCASDHRQQLRRLAAVAKAADVRVIKADCLGNCSVLGTAIYIDGDSGSATTVTNINQLTNSQLQELFYEVR